MKNAPMRFNGFTFLHNPSKLTIEDACSVAAVFPPFAEPDSILTGRKLRVVKGEGELYGADCIEQYGMLHALFLRGHRGLLSLPHMAPMTAYLKELSLSAEPRENLLGFRFVFIQAQGEATPADEAAYHTVSDQGESLWDVAYRHGKSIDTLVGLNPQIRRIDCLNAGERVRLC